MGFIAEVHLVHDELALAATIENRPETTFRYEYATSSDEQRYLFCSAFSDDHEAIESAMASDPTVSAPTRIAAFENRTIYRVVLETDLEVVPDRCGECGLFVFAITSAERGWSTRVYLPDRDALTAFRAWCRDRGVSFRVTQLYDTSISDSGTFHLTEQQHEILMMAYYGGYFDIPRGMTQDDLAERLGISDSAVSQRLRRATAELIAATVENDRMPNQ
ncbi:helix-turn-helix domain-containing protein [Natronolimnohabitans innermongolicus]|uniref:Bacterio-opsin activator HTH domain-containing protein n=1 Tax=Natronolimnohabitans innermongolicus JCM 12255 TaxID=1227499 RepID=L9XFV1_9EURY|nr:helix-turn-helix domain-containing protein [Natronolimnohabitans innermongolicus]ELY60609.1 Bacterio-opsin activator HTH domain-containing protein [Natronolimnohabitans innermongolicus JCM 12255]